MTDPCCMAAAHGQACTCQMRMTNGEGTAIDWKRAWYALDADMRALRTERLKLRNAIRALLNCPHIADRDRDPEWAEPETEAAVNRAWEALNE